MENKKKQATEIQLNQCHRSDAPIDSAYSRIVMEQTDCQLNPPVEVKEEPQSDSEEDDVSVSVNNEGGIVPAFGVGQSNGEYVFDCVKGEAKQEVIDKEKKESKGSSNSDEDAMESQRDARQQPPTNDEDEAMPSTSGHSARRLRSTGNVGDPKNVLKKHRCDFCDYSSGDKSKLKNHLLKHTGEKPHGCDLCPKSYKIKRSLHAHMKVHVKDFLFHCTGCLKGFDEKNQKIKHETECRAHRYECHLCKESFGSQKGNMMNHMRVHSGSKPFECKKCFKQFARKESLNGHLRIHESPRSFRCSNCQKGFVHQVERNAHEEKCNRDVFKCDVCGKSCLFKSNLISHMVKHTGETPFKCLRCPKKFKHKFNLNWHIVSHKRNLPFGCLVCRRGFSKDGKRKAHQRNCNARGYECYLCKKFFQSNDKLKSHTHTHSGVKPFQCKICRNTFTRNSSLKTHMKRIHNKKN